MSNRIPPSSLLFMYLFLGWACCVCPNPVSPTLKTTDSTQRLACTREPGGGSGVSETKLTMSLGERLCFKGCPFLFLSNRSNVFMLDSALNAGFEYPYFRVPLLRNTCLHQCGPVCLSLAQWEASLCSGARSHIPNVQEETLSCLDMAQSPWGNRSHTWNARPPLCFRGCLKLNILCLVLVSCRYVAIAPEANCKSPMSRMSFLTHAHRD